VLPGTNFGQVFYTATATSLCITSANAYILGILFHGTATNSAQLYKGITVNAANALCGPLVANGTTGTATVNAATFYDFPAYCSGGITIKVIGAGDPNVTLFWNPAGGA